MREREKETVRETVPAEAHPLLGLLDGEDVESLRPLLEDQLLSIALDAVVLHIVPGDDRIFGIQLLGVREVLSN